MLMLCGVVVNDDDDHVASICEMLHMLAEMCGVDSPPLICCSRAFVVVYL